MHTQGLFPTLERTQIELVSVRTNSSVGEMSRGFSLESFDAVVDVVTDGITVAITGVPAINDDLVDADAGGDDDDSDVVDTVTDWATDSVGVVDDDFDDGDDNDAGDDCEITDVVVSAVLIDEDGVIVLDDDNSDDNTGVTSDRGFPS